MGKKLGSTSCLLIRPFSGTKIASFRVFRAFEMAGMGEHGFRKCIPHPFPWERNRIENCDFGKLPPDGNIPTNMTPDDHPKTACASLQLCRANPRDPKNLYKHGRGHYKHYRASIFGLRVHLHQTYHRFALSLKWHLNVHTQLAVPITPYRSG